MKEKFPGYYKSSEEELNSIWENGLFVFDTNVLLDFYRFSDKSRDFLFDFLDGKKDKVWLPYQVAKEYHKNLYNIIVEQILKYDEASKSLESFVTKVHDKRAHPFFDDEIIEDIDNFNKKISKILEDKKEYLTNSISDNPIKEKLAIIFEDKVGDPFDDETLSNILADGTIRYSKLIPPGYMDGNDKNKSEIEKFGDLILWKEILRKAKDDSIPIIFITGDVKEDWFLKVKKNNRTIGPRPELIKEFKENTGQNICIYATTLFLKLLSQKGYNIEKNVLDEIEVSRISDDEIFRENSDDCSIESNNCINNDRGVSSIANSGLTATQIAFDKILPSSLTNSRLAATQMTLDKILPSYIANSGLTATQMALDNFLSSSLANNGLAATQMALDKYLPSSLSQDAINRIGTFFQAKKIEDSNTTLNGDGVSETKRSETSSDQDTSNALQANQDLSSQTPVKPSRVSQKKKKKGGRKYGK